MFFDEIQRGLKFDEYHSVEEIKSDLLYMMDSVIVYYEGHDKDVISRFIDYCKNLLGDCWFYYRVEDEDGFEQFLRRNQRRLKNVFWKDEVVEEIFRVFRQDCKDYPILLPRTLRKLLPPKTPTISVSPKVEGASSEVEIPDTEMSLSDEALDAEMPSLLDVEQNPQHGASDYWEFYCNVYEVLTNRVRCLSDVGLKTYMESHERALRVFTKIVASKLKNTILATQQQQFRKDYMTMTTRMEKKPIYRPTGFLVSILTPDQKAVYDTPSL